MTRTRTAPMVSVSALALALSAGAAARIDAQWTNALGGNWNVGTNWSTSPAFPNAAIDTATIGLITGATYTVTLNSAVSLAALTLNSADALLSHSAGTLNMNGGMITLTAGAYRLAGGTITAATITGAGLTTFGADTSTLSGGVTLDTDLAIVNGHTIRVNNGLTLNAGKTISLATGGNFTFLDFLGAGDQNLSGGGEVVFNGTANNGIVRASSGSLVIGSGTTVRSGTQGGAVGELGSVKNNGTIASRTNARTVTATNVTNNATGVLEATNGGTLTLAGAWSNTGTLLLNNSTINLGGSFGTSSVAPARWNRTGGTVNITGTLTNTGNTLTLDADTGSFTLSGGTITGGTVAASGGASLNTAGSFSVLNGVTLDTNTTIVNSHELRVSNGLTLNAGRTISLASGGNFTYLDFLGAGDQSLSGGGDVVFDGSNSTTGYVRANSGSLVIGAGTTVRSGTQGGAVGELGSVKNNGTIASRTNARTVTATAVTNNATGVLEATNGGTLNLAGAWSNTGTFLLDANASSTLNLGGTFGTASLDPSRWNRAGGAVNITGTLTNTGNTLTLDAQTGSFRLNGGTIIGGTVAASGAAALTTAGTTSVLNAVTLNADVSIANNHEFRVSNGLTLNAGKTISLATGANFTYLDFLGAGDQNLSGGGDVVFDGSNSNNGYVRANSGSLVIGAGTTVRSGTQGGNVGQSGTIKNNGTIAARTNARTVTATAVTNNATGVLEATNGGTLTLAGAWSNTGTVLLNNSTINLGGSFGTSSVAPARWDRTGGTVNITGTLTNTGNTLTLDADTGTFTLSGGTITGGTVAASGGAALSTSIITSTLSGGVTLDTDLSMVNNCQLNINGGLTVNPTKTVSLATGGNFTILDFLGAGDQSLSGGGDVVFNGTNSNNGFVRANSGSLVIGAGTTVRSGTQGGNVGQSGTIKNNGTIAARTSARTVTATAVTNNAAGVLEATNGGTLTLAGAWSNTGTLLLNNSTINLGGSFGTSSVAPARWDRTGGTVNITGTLTNTGNTLTLDADTGSFTLSGGTITGGAVAASGGASLTTSTVTSTLSGGVTLDTDLSIVNSCQLNINGGLTVNPTKTVSLATGGNFTILDFLGAGDQSLSGGGDVVFDGTNSNNGFVRANSGSLVIGAGTTVRSGTQGGNVGQSGTIKNNGTIAARTSARTVTATAVTNNATGVLEATNGGTLALAGAWSNTGTFLLDANASSTLNLGGSFGTASLDPSRWNRAGGLVNITGTLTNTGNTLMLNSQTGSLRLNAGTIAGGTVASDGTDGPGATLLTAGGGGALAGGVTLDTNVALINGYELDVSGGLTINPGRSVSIGATTSNTVLDVLGAGEQTVGGGGEVVFQGTSSNNNYFRNLSGTLVVGAGTTVRSGAGGGNLGQAPGSFINRGTVSSQTAGRTITVAGTAITNEGTMIAANGGTLTFDRAGGLSANTGADLIARTGGTLRFTAGMNVANNGGFDLEVASASQTLGYGRIAITGNASISGSDIDLIFTNGFTPDWGDTFNILSFTTLTGDMSSLALPTLADPTLRWWREQTASAYRVGVRHIADNNRDGVVDFLDLNRVLGTFGQAGMSLQGDGNEDGVVDFFDLNDVLSLFGQSAPPNPIPAPGALALFAGAAALGGSRRRR